MGIHFKRSPRGADHVVPAEPCRCPAELRHTRRQLLKWGSGLLAWTVAGWAPVLGGPAGGLRPSTSRASRQDAINAIPLDQLAERVRGTVSSILQRPTLFRRLPTQVIYCDPELYLFLVRYPEIIVNMWQLMGVTRVEITRTSAHVFDAKDGAGTVSQVELVYGTPETHVFLADGYYEGPLAPRRITGRCVLLLTSAFAKDTNQRDRITNQLDVFVQLDNTGIEVLAKTLHPLLGRTADSNFNQSTQFLGQVSQVVEANGPGVQRLCTRLTNVDPAVRSRFAGLAARINQRAAIRELTLENAKPPSTRLTDREDAQLGGTIR